MYIGGVGGREEILYIGGALAVGVGERGVRMDMGGGTDGWVYGILAAYAHAWMMYDTLDLVSVMHGTSHNEVDLE